MKSIISKRCFVLAAFLLILFFIPNSCKLKDPASPSGEGGTANNPASKGRVTNSITLLAEPGLLPADGISSARLTATVKDKKGNPVPDMLPVGFTTLYGNLSPNGIDKVGKQYSVNTYRGEAIAFLISDTRDVVNRVEARQGEVWAAIRIRFLRTDEDAGRIDLIADEYVGSAPFEVVLTATVYNREGVTLQGAKVTFEVMRGYGKFKNGHIKITKVTDDDGQAIAILRIESIPPDPAAPTNVIVKAECGPVWDQVTIEIERNDLPSGTFVVNPNSIELKKAALQSATVGLDATGMIDPEDGTNLIYEYSVLSNSTGCTVTIQPSTGPTTTATITATGTAVSGTIVFQVKVTDTQGGEAYATAELAVTIT